MRLLLLLLGAMNWQPHLNLAASELRASRSVASELPSSALGLLPAWLVLIVSQEASKQRIDPNLVAAIIKVESGAKLRAYNAKTRDYGLMQVSHYHVTKKNLDAKRLLEDARYNIKHGIAILSYFKKRYSKLEAKWYCRYNLGTRRLKTGSWAKKACLLYATKVDFYLRGDK